MVVIAACQLLRTSARALFFILFREFSASTPRTGCSGSACIRRLIVFSPTGLIASVTADRAFPQETVEDAAMSARQIEALPLPDFCGRIHVEGAVLAAQHIVKSFAHPGRTGVDIAVADRTLHALIGPTARQDHGVQPVVGMYAPDQARCR